MCPAVRVCYLWEFPFKYVVLLEAVRYKDPFIVPVKIQRFVVVAPFLVFIDHDGALLIQFTGTVHPHVTLAVGMIAVCDHLRRRFIRLCDMQRQQF